MLSHHRNRLLTGGSGDAPLFHASFSVPDHSYVNATDSTVGIEAGIYYPNFGTGAGFSDIVSNEINSKPSIAGWGGVGSSWSNFKDKLGAGVDTTLPGTAISIKLGTSGTFSSTAFGFVNAATGPTVPTWEAFCAMSGTVAGKLRAFFNAGASNVTGPDAFWPSVGGTTKYSLVVVLGGWNALGVKWTSGPTAGFNKGFIVWGKNPSDNLWSKQIEQAYNWSGNTLYPVVAHFAAETIVYDDVLVDSGFDDLIFGSAVPSDYPHIS